MIEGKQEKDTIVAVSSSGPISAAELEPIDLPRAIIRLSGARAFSLAASVFTPSRTLDNFELLQGWRRINGQVNWQSGAGQSFPLQSTAYVMRSPRSYTRENVVELHVPAMPWLLSSLLELLIKSGARLAEPGEFTRRAFENGRITIEQAETIAALISSQNSGEARVYSARLNSITHRLRGTFRSDLEELLSLVELGLDFSHEDVGVLSPEEILLRLNKLEICAIAMSAETSREATGIVDAGLPRVLLMGPTNAGKSTLFNKLLGRDAAIVSELRHTTRDLVQEEMFIQTSSGRLCAVLQDSAGWGAEINAVAASQPDDFAWLRRAAWNNTVSAVRCADIILLTLDGSRPLDQDDISTLKNVLAQAKPDAIAMVLTKADLSGSSGIQDAGAIELVAPDKVFQISSVVGTGVAELRQFIAQQLERIGVRRADALISAGTMSRMAAKAATEAIHRASEAIKAGHGEDVVAVELREALHAFWKAEGILVRHDAITEAALDRIFSQFCIGK